MSHEIGEYDMQFGREMAWHGLTNVRENLSLENDDFYLKEWDIKVALAKFYDSEGNLLISEGDLKRLYVDLREDGHEAPLYVSESFNDSYVPLANRDFIELIQEALTKSGLPYDVESVGTVFNRRRTFVSIPLHGKTEFEVGGREFKSYLNFVNSFDGSTPFMANTSNICVVCNNTLSANLETGGCLVKHTKKMASRLEGLPDVIAEAINVQEGFANDFLILHSKEISEDHTNALFASFLSNGDKMSTQAFNRTQRLTELFMSGAGNNGKTYADIFSAFTDFYTHESAGGETNMKQFVSSEFGPSSFKKREAMQFLMKCVDVKAEASRQIARGRQLIKDYEAK